jgi:hypothetical protein
MYLNPHNEVKGGLRATFGNPTPLALIGFLLSISPLSCQMMDWRGSGGGDDAGIASVGSYYFMVGTPLRPLDLLVPCQAEYG